MSYFNKRALRWAAPVALVGALGLAACGNGDDTEAVRAAAPSVAGLGSDQHLNNAADEIARAQRANEAASARLAGEAERQAHLDGNAETYANLSAESASGLAEEQAATVASAAPNNRAAIQAQADTYVEQQQDRASENTDSENAPNLPHYSENSRASENTDSENAPIHYSENSRP